MGDISTQETSTAPGSSNVPAANMSPSDRKLYNKMATHMDLFHNNFRHMWNEMYSACTSGHRPRDLSLRQFLRIGEDFCRYLTTHHTIEEMHIFPVLAEKMACFREDQLLITQHQGIHDGLVRFEEYLTAVRSGEREFRLAEMKGVMDSFGTVLWTHLDAEVEALGAENMIKYWTREEMRGLPMGID